MPAPNAELLTATVRLRLAIQQTRDPSLRDELRQVEVGLRRHLPTGIQKGVAAHLLGVSVTALDRWIRRLPAVAHPSSSRLAVETGPLLDLAVQVETLKRSGVKRGLLARAFTQLGWPERGKRLVYRADVACLPRPNQSYDELRHEFEETTPEERLLQLNALHRSMNSLAEVER
jgi:hypothetical protein